MAKRFCFTFFGIMLFGSAYFQLYLISENVTLDVNNIYLMRSLYEKIMFFSLIPVLCDKKHVCIIEKYYRGRSSDVYTPL